VRFVDVDTLRFLIIDEYRGRALTAMVISDDIEELQRVIGTSLLNYYESEFKRLNEALEKQRKDLEEEKKLRHPDARFIKDLEESIASLEKRLNVLERKKEALVKLLELLAFL